MFKMKFDVVVDLQFGSTGKGALAGFLSNTKNYEMVVSANMPNAGHTAYCPDTGKKFVHKVLPSGIFSENLKMIGVGSGAGFTIDRLEEEWKNVSEYLLDMGFEGRHEVGLVIHEAAIVVDQHHKEREAASLSKISSTMQGSGAALVDKIMRVSGAIAKNHEFEILERLSKHGKVTIASNKDWNSILLDHETILVEGSQGYSLSNSAGFYPYCTSRDCTTARIIADCGMPPRNLSKVYGSVRVHPIRVGNTPDGFSGDWYPDQTEIDFKQLNVEAETTTVTGRVRRIATFSCLQIQEAMQVCQPDEVFLNFAQYDPEATDAAYRFINDVAAILGRGRVTMLGHGALPSDVEVLP